VLSDAETLRPDIRPTCVEEGDPRLSKGHRFSRYNTADPAELVI
jgi:hypothetical protein